MAKTEPFGKKRVRFIYLVVVEWKTPFVQLFSNISNQWEKDIYVGRRAGPLKAVTRKRFHQASAKQDSMNPHLQAGVVFLRAMDQS